nr:uncharacterized protein LOC102147828 isoform X2 [Equus caballus]
MSGACSSAILGTALHKSTTGQLVFCCLRSISWSGDLIYDCAQISNLLAMPSSLGPPGSPLTWLSPERLRWFGAPPRPSGPGQLLGAGCLLFLHLADTGGSQRMPSPARGPARTQPRLWLQSSDSPHGASCWCSTHHTYISVNSDGQWSVHVSGRDKRSLGVRHPHSVFTASHKQGALVAPQCRVIQRDSGEHKGHRIVLLARLGSLLSGRFVSEPSRHVRIPFPPLPAFPTPRPNFQTPASSPALVEQR